jgi:hypothetical protein
MSTNPDSTDSNYIATNQTGTSRLAEIQGQQSRFKDRNLMLERARILSRRTQGGRI